MLNEEWHYSRDNLFVSGNVVSFEENEVLNNCNTIWHGVNGINLTDKRHNIICVNDKFIDTYTLIMMKCGGYQSNC